MAEYIPLSKTEHQMFGYQGDKPFEFAQDWSFIPLSSVELGKALPHYPICFQKNDLGFQMGLPTGLGRVNCLVHPQNGRFLLPYVPAVLRRYPFNMLKTEQSESVLCVLKGEAGFAKGQGEAVIDKEGELTEKGTGLVKFLNQLNLSFERDALVCKRLEELDLLVELPFQIKDEQTGDLKKTREDIYKVDEQKLNQLSAEDIQALMLAGALPVIYAHLFSMQQLNQLQTATQTYSKLVKQPESQAQDLDALFGDDDSDVLKFE